MKLKLKKYQDGGYVKPEEVYNYLISKGLSHNHAVGMLNNIRHESNFNIGVQEKGNTQQGVGLFQYSYPTRKESFLKAVPDYKTNWKGQVDFALTEDITKRYLNEKFDDSAAASVWFTNEWEKPLDPYRDDPEKNKGKQRLTTIDLYNKYKVSSPNNQALELNISPAIPSDNTKTKLAPLVPYDNKALPKGDSKNTKTLSPLMLDKKKMGGEVFKAAVPQILSTATSLIPGGQMFAPLVGALATKALETPEETPVIQEDRTMTNPYGLKYGGAAPKNLRALHGGRLDKVAGDVYLAKGKPHSKGGIKGDTDSDGKAEIEFEGGELFLDKDGYMISKPIAKKYKSALERLGKASDSASKSTLARLKRVMIADNEQYRQANDPSLKMKKGGKLPKMQYAGPVFGLEETQPIAYNSLSSMMFPQATTPGIVTTPVTAGVRGMRYPTTSFRDASGSNNAMDIASRQRLAANNTTGSSVRASGEPVGTTYAKTGVEGLAGTLGNKFLVAGHLPGLAYNAFMAMQPAEVQKPVYNPYERDITSNLSKMRINPREIENQFTTAMGAGMRTIGNMSTSQGNRLANTVGLYGNISKAKAAQRLASQQAQISIDQYKNQTLQNLGAERVAAKQFADAQTNANKAAKQNFERVAAEGVGDVLTQVGVNSNQNLTNDMLFKTMQNTFDYKFNETEYYNMLKGIKPAGMPESEWIIFKRFAANNGILTTEGR